MKVLIEIEGGMVIDVTAEKDIEVHVVDYDSQDNDEPIHQMYTGKYTGEEVHEKLLDKTT